MDLLRALLVSLLGAAIAGVALAQGVTWQLVSGDEYRFDAPGDWQRFAAAESDEVPVVLAGERHSSGRRQNVQLSVATEPVRPTIWREVIAAETAQAQSEGTLLSSRELSVEGRDYLEIERTVTTAALTVPHHFVAIMGMSGPRLWRIQCGAPEEMWPATRAACLHVVQSFRVGSRGSSTASPPTR